MLNLCVIPSDPIEEYVKKGLGPLLQEYYNPRNFFDKVYLFSPLEKEERKAYGMHIIPTEDTQLKKRLKEYQINIVRAYGGNWPCDMACHYKVNGIPVVVSIHDRREQWLHNSIKYADIVFSVSQDVSSLILTKMNRPDDVWLLPNRVDFNIMHRIPKDRCRDLDAKYPFMFKILHVGRKSPEKNLETIFKALKILGDPYGLITIGSGDIAYYQHLAQQEGVDNRCVFIEKVNNDELHKYYSWADCLCNPSHSEAMSLAIIEALACETIVITSAVAANSTNIKHRENGIILEDQRDPQQIADTINEICHDEAFRERLRSNILKSVEIFKKERVDALECDFYQKILAMNQRGEFKLSVLCRARQLTEVLIKRVLKYIGSK